MPTVYVTAPPDAADEIAGRLVEEELAACVNQVDCTSIYRWNGDVVEDDERILFVKTTDDAYDELEDRIRTLHPYDVPCVERFDEADELDAFAEWRSGAVESSTDR